MSELSSAWFPLRYHEKQCAAWRTQARFLLLACGRRSGKTLLAKRRVVRYLPIQKPWRDPMYFYAMPTYGQCKRVAWDDIVALIPPRWIAKKSESELCVRTIFGSSLWLCGLDNPARIEGSGWDGGVVDESSDIKPGAWGRSIRPALSDRNGWAWRIGVPKRFGVGAVEFRRACEEAAAGKLPDHEFYTWPSSDVLPDYEIASAARELDARDFAEQYGATWQEIGGRIFYAFDDVQNVTDRAQFVGGRRIIVGCDFNVDPMCWVVGHAASDGLVVFDEIFMRDANTQRALDELDRRYNQPQPYAFGWDFIGDASSRARKTSAAMSDYMIIKNDKRFLNSRVFFPEANPPVADRFAACNALACNALGKRRWLVNPRCKRLREDVRVRAYAQGTREPDDKNPDVGHMSDAVGYVIHRLWPVVIDLSGEPGAAVGGMM
jgi:hypothetical protein